MCVGGEEETEEKTIRFSCILDLTPQWALHPQNMADSSSSNNISVSTTKFIVTKVPNDVKTSGKHGGNVIHRTTSESLRIGGANNDNHGNGSSSSVGSNASSVGGGGGGGGSSGGSTNSISSATNQRNSKPKTSSFQITSVTVGTGRMSTDNGEDSADDLDESHTDDNSRITDLENETPSFSEDTFSKEDVFFSTTNMMGTAAPVIPTSSQYGLAIVAPTEMATLGGHHILTDMPINVTDGNLVNVGGSNVKSDVDLKDLNHRNERFKVVKIESTEPFKRGRWMCMDYLDHTTLQQNNNNKEGGDGDGVTIPNNTNNNAVITNDNGVVLLENNMDVDSVGTASSIKSEIGGPQTYDNIQKQPNHPQSMINMNVTSNVHPTINQSHQHHHPHHQTMPQGHIQQIISQQQNETPISVDNSSINAVATNIPAQYYGTTNQNLANYVQGATLPINQMQQQQHPQHQVVSMVNLNVHHQSPDQHHIDTQQMLHHQQQIIDGSSTHIQQQANTTSIDNQQQPPPPSSQNQPQNILPVLQQQSSTTSNVSSQSSSSTLVTAISNDSSIGGPIGNIDMAGAAALATQQSGGVGFTVTQQGNIPVQGGGGVVPGINASDLASGIDTAVGGATAMTTSLTTISDEAGATGGLPLGIQGQPGAAAGTTEDGQSAEDSERYDHQFLYTYIFDLF